MYKKRWISMYVENRNGVLARISGLMSGKCYNIDSITVGTTEDPTVSRMTIGLYSDEPTFEQIKKQLNRCVETIKVIDITDAPTHMKELLFIHIKECSEFEKGEIFRVAQVFGAKPIDYGMDSVLLESVNTESRNNDIINLLMKKFKNVEIVRGGVVAIESISMKDR
jgi:acetolactate synthase-1/3 small subunit